MKGLDVAVLKLNEVLAESEKFRIDSQYFSKEIVEAIHRIKSKPDVETIGSIVSSFRKGIFDIKAATYKEQGIPFIRISNLKGPLMDLSDAVFIDPATHEAERKTALVRGNIALSKTAYPAASLVTIAECNVSQDIIAMKLSSYGRRRILPSFLAVYLNTRYGLALLKREFQGNVQEHLSLPDGQKVLVPVLGSVLQNRVQQCVYTAHKERNKSERAYTLAEDNLLQALGLENWTPDTPLTYKRSAREVFRSERLDAEFHTPPIQALLQRLGSGKRSIEEVAPLRTERFNSKSILQSNADGKQVFNYIEIGDVGSYGMAMSKQLNAGDAPDRAQWIVRTNDVITSTVRPIRKLSAMIQSEQDGFVCSSGFVVLNPQMVAPEILLTYLRLKPICILLDLYTTASMYPALTSSVILDFPLPIVSNKLEEHVINSIQSVFTSRSRSELLLDAAKRAVEIAIEDSEAVALRYIDEEEAKHACR